MQLPRVCSLRIAALLGAASLVASAALAQGPPQQGEAPPALVGVNDDGVIYGSSDTADAGAQQDNLGDIPPAINDDGNEMIFPETRFATNGVSLRNCKWGGINLVGIPPGSRIVGAWLYWGWASLAAPTPGVHDIMRLVRYFPRPRMRRTVVGTLVGTGADPCWLGASNWVYRADVLAQHPGLVTGGGTYTVILPKSTGSQFDYTDPWGFPGPIAPLAEGATLVVVYQNDVEPMGTTVIYDRGLSGFMYLSFPGLVYNLVGFPPVRNEARWATVTADGQVGAGYLSGVELGWETTFELNTGMPISGGGPFGITSPYNDSNQNGSGNKPLGQLWDTAGHDVTQYLAGFPTFPVLITSPGVGGADCLVPVCDVMWTR